MTRLLASLMPPRLEFNVVEPVWRPSLTSSSAPEAKSAFKFKCDQARQVQVARNRLDKWLDARQLQQPPNWQPPVLKMQPRFKSSPSKLTFHPEVKVFVYDLTEEERVSKMPTYSSFDRDRDDSESESDDQCGELENEIGVRINGSKLYFRNRFNADNHPFLGRPAAALAARNTTSASTRTNSRENLVPNDPIMAGLLKRRRFETVEPAGGKMEGNQRQHKLRRMSTQYNPVMPNLKYNQCSEISV